MDVKAKLSQVVGNENFSDDPATLQTYATDFSRTPAGAANYVVKPASAEEVSAVIKLCNENHIPVVPCSSKVHFFGATIPKEGGLVLDMSRMDKILEIDPDNRRVRFEAGVTWDKLTRELKKQGFRVVMPLTPRPNDPCSPIFWSAKSPPIRSTTTGSPSKPWRSCGRPARSSGWAPQA